MKTAPPRPAKPTVFSGARKSRIVRGQNYNPEDQQLRESKFRDFGQVESPAGIDHGGLSGLSDDDHPQYLLKSGGTMSAPLLLAAGAVGAPSLTFAGDTNTGIYSGTADTIRFATGGALKVTLDTILTLGEAVDLAFGTTTGTKIGTTSSQKLGFFGATPIVRNATAFTQTYSTADKTHADFTSADLATTAATNVAPWGFATQAQADNIATQVNLLRADVADIKQFVNSLVDDLQALGLIG